MSILYFLVGFTGIYALIAQMTSWTWGPQLLLKIFEVLIMVPCEMFVELLFAILEGIFSALD